MRALGLPLGLIALSAVVPSPAYGGYITGPFGPSPALLDGSAQRQVHAALAFGPDTFTVRDVFLAPADGFAAQGVYDLTIGLSGSGAPPIYSGPVTATLVQAVGEAKFDLVFHLPTSAVASLQGDSLLEVTVRPAVDPLPTAVNPPGVGSSLGGAMLPGAPLPGVVGGSAAHPQYPAGDVGGRDEQAAGPAGPSQPVVANPEPPALALFAVGAIGMMGAQLWRGRGAARLAA